MSRPKVLITHCDIPKRALALLKDKCEVTINTELPYPSYEQIKAKVPGMDAIFYVSKYTLDAGILDAAGPQMKVIGAMSAGTNHLDVELIKSRGIALSNTPEVLNDAVADVAVLLVLSAARRAVEGRLEIEKGTWTFGPQWHMGQDVAESTVGIVGLGGIGQSIVQRLKPFNVSKFLYTGHKEKPEGKQLKAKFVNLDTLLKESDFVIASCPLTAETEGMFNDSTFAKMKSTSIFVNIARGGLVVQDDLVKALKNKTIFAAGLDVMTPEPLPTDHVLLSLPNCVLLPHVGSATHNTRAAMAHLTAQNILRGLAGEEMFTPV